MAHKAAVLEVEVPLYQDPFHPVLRDSSALHTSDEQELYIREVLEICCSDSASAKKAYKALQYILTTAPPVPPVLSSLNPSTATVGSPAFSLQVNGTGFTEESKIWWNEAVAVTAFMSETSLSTPLDLSAVVEPTTYTVQVRNADETVSEIVNFDLTAPILLSAKKDVKLGHELEKQKEESIKNKVENFNTPEHRGQDKK